MRLASLTVDGFRNLASQEMHFRASTAILIGRNGQGKTSVLEAIYLLAQARSFRGARISELARWGERAQFHVEGEVETSSGKKTIRVEFKDGRRRVSINGNVVTAAEMFYGEVAAVEFTPDDLLIVKGGPAGRRSFVDRILSMSDRGYVGLLVNYTRALKQRNLVLGMLRRGGVDVTAPEVGNQLEPWEHLLARYGSGVVRRRAEFLAELSGDIEELYRSLVFRAPGQESVRVGYESEIADSGTVLPEEEIVNRYRASRSEDLRRGATSIGPHRDDVPIDLDIGDGFHAARSSASQGQVRSIALALKMAATRYLERQRGEPPILLLDDVESELDDVRRSALQSLIRELRAQVILTETEVSDELRGVSGSADVFAIRDGRISLAKGLDFSV